MVKFECDEKKNFINIKKHNISFEEAILVFTDENAIIMKDLEHSINE